MTATKTKTKAGRRGYNPTIWPRVEAVLKHGPITGKKAGEATVKLGQRVRFPDPPRLGSNFAAWERRGLIVCTRLQPGVRGSAILKIELGPKMVDPNNKNRLLDRPTGSAPVAPPAPAEKPKSVTTTVLYDKLADAIVDTLVRRLTTQPSNGVTPHDVDTEKFAVLEEEAATMRSDLGLYKVANDALKRKAKNAEAQTAAVSERLDRVQHNLDVAAAKVRELTGGKGKA